MYAREEYAEHGPIEAWMSSLHSDQTRLVRQRWNGPARISGAAGTGKTVVALHRAVDLAHRDRGPILCTTLVRNLPAVQKSLMLRLDPDLDDRVECVNLHRWARGFLRSRGTPVDAGACRTSSTSPGRGWGSGACCPSSNRGPVLAGGDRLCDQGSGHRDVRRVRRGRAPRPPYPLAGSAPPPGVAAVRRVREPAGRGRPSDFADLLLAALAEVRREPLETPYASVIVDEVQDLTLTAVRLLHALVGDAPDGLLLIGDGQQKVYPGGFKLSDAGVSVRGRARVLRHNYRNGSAIFERAQQFLAGATFDDIDDGEPDHQPVGITDRVGQVVDVFRASEAELARPRRHHHGPRRRPDPAGRQRGALPDQRRQGPLLPAAAPGGCRRAGVGGL